jgi:hypothetical protein
VIYPIWPTFPPGAFLKTAAQKDWENAEHPHRALTALVLLIRQAAFCWPMEVQDECTASGGECSDSVSQ